MRSEYLNLLQNMHRLYIVTLVFAGIALLQFVSKTSHGVNIWPDIVSSSI